MGDLLKATAIVALIIGCAIALGFTPNIFTAEKWNGGECPKCEVFYELKTADKLNKYYQCPACGERVRRVQW